MKPSLLAFLLLPIACAARSGLRALDGPFADLPTLWRKCHGGWDKEASVTTTLGEEGATGGRAVSLREYVDSENPAAGTCAVTIKTDAGIHVGPGFLCTADRSDELVSTAGVTV